MFGTALLLLTGCLQAPPAVVLEWSPAGLQADVTLNGQPSGAGPLKLVEGLNVLALDVAAGPSVAPAVRLGPRRCGPDSGWQVATQPPADWRTRFDAAGWSVSRAATIPVPAGGVRLRKALFVPPEAPQWFPNQDRVWLPRGAANLVRPYVNRPADLALDDVTMVLELPVGLRCVAVDGAVGQPVQAIAQEGGLARLSLGTLHGSGFELSLRWGDAAGRTIAYQPAIREGGTFDWRTIATDVVAPPGAVSLTPLIVKWQNRGITGTFWVDDLTITTAGSPDLLGCGSFDEPAWGATFANSAGEGVGGSRCVRITARPGDEAKQGARWVRIDERAPVTVAAGATYRIQLALKCDQVRSDERRSNVAALVEVPRDAPEGVQPFTAWLEACDGALVEVAAASEVVVLPELLDIRPRTTRITPCYYGDVFADPRVRQAYADNAWASGITSLYGQSNNTVAAALRPKGLTVLLSLPWHPWQAIGPLTAEGERQAVGFGGQAEANTLCPTWLLANLDRLRPELGRLIGALVADGSYFGVDWDIEQPVIDPPTFCVCGRCQAAFATTLSGLAGQAITPDNLLAAHRAAWVAFRCRQNATLAGFVREVVKAANPRLEFSVYSGYQSLRTQEHYGVDWAALAPYLDLGIAGYGGAPDEVVATDEALGAVPFMPGEMYYLSPTSDERAAPNPLSWRNRLLRCWLRGDRVGMLIWYLPTMDGGAFWGTSEAAAAIARHEASVTGAKRLPVGVTGSLPPENVFAFEKDGQAQVWCFNLGGEPVQGVIQVAGQAALRVDLAAYDYAVLPRGG